MTFPDPDRSSAVIIGTSTFADSDLADLASVKNNVRGLWDALCLDHTLKLPSGRCLLILDPQRPHELFNPLVDASQQAEDLFLVYYAGHGLLEGDDGELHLALGMSRQGQPWTSAPFRNIARVLLKNKARTKVLLLDCCYSGRAMRFQMSNSASLPMEQIEVAGTYTMTSVSENKRSLAPEGETYTAFTGELIDILVNGIPGQGRDLTFIPIYEEVRKRLRKRGLPDPQQLNKNGALNLSIARNQSLYDSGFDPRFYLTTFIHQYENFETVRSSRQQWVVEPIARENLFAVYVPQQCADGKGNMIELDAYVRAWLDRDRQGSLVILGEYGYGKTSYCLNLTYRLLRRWQRDPKATYFPIFLSFRDFVPTEETKDALSSCEKIVQIFHQQFHLISDDKDFPGAFKDRKLLLILDGLDEIEKSLNVSWVRRQFQSIGKVVQKFAKVIVTCRVSYLPTEDDVHRVMSRDQHDLVVGSVAPGGELDIVTLRPFGLEQKTRYVELAVRNPAQRDRLLTAIERIRDLPDLTTRPVLLWMVVNVFKNDIFDLDDSTEVSAAQLYERFTRQWIECELDQDHIGRDVLENQELMHRLALKIYRDPSEQIHKDELRKELEISFRGRSRAEIARLEHEFVVCSFLRPSQVDHLSFVHRSFMEFFVAHAYRGYIRDNRPEAFGREGLRPGLVVQFLSQLIKMERANSARDRLVRWLEAARVPKPGEPRLAANAATVLCHLGFPFDGVDLSNVDLRDADLSGGDFRYAILRGAKLDNAILENAKLSYSDLENADMSNIFIRKTDFKGANLRGARIKNPRIIGGLDTIWIALYSRDRQHIVIGTDRGCLIILENCCTYPELARHFVHESGVMNIAFSSDGMQLAVTNRQREIYIYDWSALLQGRQEQLAVFAENANYVRWVEFSPNGPRLASGARDLMVKIWFLGDDSYVTNLRFHVRDVMVVTWSPDGRWLASGGYDGTIALWDANAQRPTPVGLRDRTSTAQRRADSSIENQSHEGVVRALAFSPKGDLLASSSEDHTIKLWNMADPSCPALDATIRTDQDVFCLVFVDAGATLVAGDSAGNLLKVDLEQRLVFHAVHAHDSRIRSIDLDHNRAVLLSSSWDGSVKAWNVNDLSLIEKVYQLENGDVVYQPTDAFRDANIEGVRDLEDKFLDYFVELGAMKDSRSAMMNRPVKVKETVMPASEPTTDELFRSMQGMARETLYDGLCDTLRQPWYDQLFCQVEPGIVPEKFAHFDTLAEAGVIGLDGTVLYRLNSIDGMPFVTDGLWRRRNGVFPFSDESELLLDYCREHCLEDFDEVVDPGSGCGHTPIALPGRSVRNALDVDARAVEFARLNAWLNERELTAVRNDITRGFPFFVKPAAGRRVLFVANMPFAISPYAEALSHVRDGGENGIRLSVSVLEAVRPFVGTNSKLVILTYSLGRSGDQSWQFVQRACQILPDCELCWELRGDKIWRVGPEKVESNPMSLSSLKKKAFSPIYTPEEQRRLSSGYDKLSKELESLGWDTLGCGILEVTL